MPDPIKMPFGMLSRVGPRNHVLDGVSDSHGKGQFGGKDMPGHARQHCRELCKKAEPIEMPFGLWARVG